MSRLVVAVRGGALDGTKAVVAPNGTLRVGRIDRADLAIERDASMSGVHFEIVWDGATCTLRDLASARGTLLSGAPIAGEAVVPHGGWIKAGETSFSVYVEARSPPRSEPANPAHATRALAALAPLRGRLYAVLDAARDERVLELLRESIDETRSLYEGVRGEALADVAPYLVGFAAGSELLERVVREGWGKSFGVFIESAAPFKALRRHLRRFLIVAEESTDKRLYFRYYDPRALREILPILTVRQADVIYGDVIDGFLTETEEGEVRVFRAPAADVATPDARALDAAHP